MTGIRTTILLACVLFSGILLAHDGGHKRPDALPPVGPHGGKYGKMKRHFAEVVVRGRNVTFYILEPDVKFVAQDASKVKVMLKIPRRSGKRLRLTKQKKGKGYTAKINIPRTARRVYFHVSCVLDGKKEKGRILYEPRR